MCLNEERFGFSWFIFLFVLFQKIMLEICRNFDTLVGFDQMYVWSCRNETLTPPLTSTLNLRPRCNKDVFSLQMWVRVNMCFCVLPVLCTWAGLQDRGQERAAVSGVGSAGESLSCTEEPNFSYFQLEMSWSRSGSRRDCARWPAASVHHQTCSCTGRSHRGSAWDWRHPEQARRQPPWWSPHSWIKQKG